jgi:hypothetical protein
MGIFRVLPEFLQKAGIQYILRVPNVFFALSIQHVQEGRDWPISLDFFDFGVGRRRAN